MKKNILILAYLFIYCLSSFAQLNGDGYYRIRNLGSQRYIIVTDNKGSVNVSSTSADLGAVKLLKNFSNVVSDPGSILYVNEVNGQYRFEAQGTDTHEIIGYDLKLKQSTNGTYLAYQEESVLRMYLCDGRKEDTEEGSMSTKSDATTHRNWEILPLSTSGDNYFGITSEYAYNGSYYSTLYASFPFTFASSGMSAYYVSKVENGVAVLAEVANNTVPASMPVIIKTASSEPSANRLNIGANIATKPTDNKLSGVYFHNTSKKHNNLTPYNPETMRVLGITSTGKLGFIKASLDYLPANKAYLNVSAGSPDELELMTKEEYDNRNIKVKVSAIVGGEVIGGGEYKINNQVSLTAKPDAGYHFVKWSDGSTANPYNFTAKSDVSLEATFAPNSYQLTYVVDGAQHYSQSVVYGSILYEIQEPIKEGYTFTGWSGLPATMPAGDVIVTGSFEVNRYQLVYMLDGEVYQTEWIAYGSSLVVAPDPFKEGYTFNGWGEVPATMPASKLVIAGEMVPNLYQVSYVVDGQIYAIDSVECDASFKVLPVPVKEGYNFDGWHGTPSVMPAHDIILDGTFVINKDNKFNLIYMLDGQEYKRELVSFGDVLTIEPDPVKEGYTFGGWSELPETMPLQDVTIVGEFTVNRYALVYILDGEVYAQDSVAYGDRLSLLDVAEKEGYTFTGWKDAPKTMPFEDLTLTGEYQVNNYLLTYIVDGEVYAQESVAYGSPIVLIDDLVKEGYIFSGWSEVPETMPATNVKVVAVFTVDGIEETLADRLVDVYTLQGMRVKAQVPMSDIQKELPAGIYIVNGRKMLVK